MQTRRATAQWEGSLKEGAGNMKLGSGAFEGAFSFSTRFEKEPGTNPEELIGAALAGCFSMALSAGLGNAGFTPEKIKTGAEVDFGVIDGQATISVIRLTTEAVIPGIENDQFLELAEETKSACPVSRALAGVKIELTASLL